MRPAEMRLNPEDEAAALQAVKQGGPWRENARADDWIGKPIAAALEIELDAEGRRRVERLIEAWIKDGTLSAYEQKDANSVNRKFLRISDDAANDNEEDSEIDFG